MNVTDEDMQMVRTWLEEAKAPFHIQSHFENLLGAYEGAAARIEDLEDENKVLREEESARFQKLQDDYDELKDEQQAEADDAALGALETVNTGCMTSSC